ncbi:MAG: transglycosylase SLT domain-containing protein [Gemmatimonadota bacterium]
MRAGRGIAGRAWGAVLGLALVGSACTGRGTSVPPPPAPVDVSLPAPEVTPAWEPGWAAPDAPETGPLDPILTSRTAFHPDLEADIARWVERYAVEQTDWFAAYLTRMGRYGPLVDSVLAELGAPPSLRYLPIVESGYSPHAVSRVSAAGMWQFMAPVARSMGMQVDRIVDERHDPHRATPAAIQYLMELEQRFDSWFLALAAYNGGPTRVSRLLRRHAPLAPLNDSLFLVIRPHLPRETREFVPKFLAAATLAEAPERFGLGPDGELAPLEFDVVTVPDATTLDVVAGAAGVPEEEVRELNPQLRRGITPRGRRTVLRIPRGRAAAFAEAYARIPPEERVTITEHVVSAGETLWDIARRYGIRSAELESANPRIRPERLQIGTVLVVPLVPRDSS